MKVPLRILVILISIGILIYASLPPEPSEEITSTPEAEPQTPATQTDPNLIRDFLGGTQLDAGKKAKETLNTLSEDREEDLEELGLE
jgi:hypothetical protein